MTDVSRPQLLYRETLLAGTGPFLRWAGGKRALLKHILPHVPGKFGCYYESFLGGGALFFALQPSKAVLSDQNPELINCYIQVRDRSQEVIEHLNSYRNTEKDYYRIRDLEPTPDAAGAARLIYLVSLSFNGLYRLNEQGKFNVPYGDRRIAVPWDVQKIILASHALKKTRIVDGDFEKVAEKATDGDFVYFDPPYTVAHGNNGFLKYNAKIFTWEDQIRLAKLARTLADRGCKVVISNADHPSLHVLYSDFKITVIQRHSGIAASPQFRRIIQECLIYN